MENVFADVRFDGPTTINADQGDCHEYQAGEQVGASVTFAYNPTPINVPVTKESADSKVRGVSPVPPVQSTRRTQVLLHSMAIFPILAECLIKRAERRS